MPDELNELIKVALSTVDKAIILNIETNCSSNKDFETHAFQARDFLLRALKDIKSVKKEYSFESEDCQSCRGRGESPCYICGFKGIPGDLFCLLYQKKMKIW